MAVKPPGYIIATATQGSNDAFAQTSVTTGLSLIGNLGYQVRGIHFQHSALQAVNGVELVLALTRRSKTASAGYVDPDCIWSEIITVQMATSGLHRSPRTGVWVPPGPVYIVEDSIFLQIDSTGTSAQNAVTIRIEYDIVRVTDAERNALLARTTLTTAQ